MSDSDPRPFADADAPLHWVRARHFRISHVDLEVTVDLDAQRVEGTVIHQVELLVHGRGEPSIVLDQRDLRIAAAEIDGQPARFSLGDGQVSIAVPLATPRAFALRLTFTADHPAQGMYFIAAAPPSGVPKDPGSARVAMAWTQGAMEDHSCWFPCFDDPNNLASYRIAIRHRSALAAIANGVRESAVDHGDGWTTTTWLQNQPHVLYLVNVAVGDFVGVDDRSGPVPITHWLPRGHETKAPAIFRATAFAITWLGNFVGVPFAWSRYGHVVVHGFMWGGMENTTLTTITDRALMDAAVQGGEDVNVDSLVIHELAHQWFGDLLTMKGWADIWLNESFATYLEARGTAAWKATLPGGAGKEAELAALEFWNNREEYLGEDRGRYRRALVTNRYADPYDLFDRVAYEKGSLILNHLCAVLGEERFRAAVQLYVSRHVHDLVETGDFRQALEDATGEPLDWFFAQWMYRPGHPKLKVRSRHDPGRGQLLVEIEQVHAGADCADGSGRYRLPTAIAWATDDGTLQRQLIEIDKCRETLVIPCAAAPAWVALDPDGHLPAEWDEDAAAPQLAARLADRRLGAQARARAAGALGGKHLPQAIVAALGATVADSTTPELVRLECIAALGEVRTAAALHELHAAWPRLAEPRLRRAAARAFAKFRRQAGTAALAGRLVELADADTSLLTAGELYAARGALEHPGATPLLRGRMGRLSWNQRLRAGCVRGFGDSGEPAAVDEVLAVLAEPAEHDAVRQAACGAAATLGARLPVARDRARRALEAHLDSASLHTRMAAIKALGALGDPAARGPLADRLGRELFGNVRRVIRESLDQLGKAAAVTTAVAELAKRVGELEQEKKKLEARVEAVEKRLESPDGGVKPEASG